MGNITDVTHREKATEHNELVREWERFNTYKVTFKQQIEEAYNAQYLESLQDKILELSHLTVCDLLDHLEQQCLALTHVEIEAKMAETRIPWDLHNNIKIYFAK